MKVWDLRCAHDHAFEGWFDGEEDFASQDARGLLECPLCANREITRLPSAPRLNLGSHREPVPAAPDSGDGPTQAKWLHAVREVLSKTEDVGAAFADEARRIHYGEVEARGIRGQASSDDAQALADEGIAVQRFVLPAALKETLQ